MIRYRIILTMSAPNREVALGCLPILDQLPEGTVVQIQNLDERRTLGYSLILVATALFWVALYFVIRKVVS